MNTERKIKTNTTPQINRTPQAGQTNKPSFKTTKHEDIKRKETGTNSSNSTKKVQQKSNHAATCSIPLVSDADAENYFTPPPEVLYPRQKLRQLLEWKTKDTSAVGLINQGHTCFMDASLQCLFFTPAFCQFILQSDHINNCLYLFPFSLYSLSFILFQVKNSRFVCYANFIAFSKR